MPVACVDIAEVVCVAPAYRAVTEVGGFVIAVDRRGRRRVVSPAVEARLGARIEVIVADDLTPFREAGLSRLTAHGWRVVYAKRCSPDQRTCQYDWGAVPDDGALHMLHLSTFRIRGRSQAGLAAAERNTWLVWGSNSTRHGIQVSRLIASAQEPQRCGNTPEPGCPDDDIMRMRRSRR